MRRARASRGFVAVPALVFGLVAAVAGARITRAADEAEPAKALSGGAECDVSSRYMWRGLALSQGAVAQPSVWLTHSAFTLTLWGSGALDARDPSGFHELDPSIGYERDLGGWSLKPSVYWYRYPGAADPGSTEMELVVSRGIKGSIRAFARQTVDVGAYSGASSGAFGLSRESEAEGRWTWTAGGQLMWGSTRV